MDDERVHVVLKLRKICRSAPGLVVSKVRVAPCEPLEALIKSCGAASSSNLSILVYPRGPIVSTAQLLRAQHAGIHAYILSVAHLSPPALRFEQLFRSPSHLDRQKAPKLDTPRDPLEESLDSFQVY